MSGHSKWSKIKRQKGIKDVQKGAVFAKLSRLITLAVVEGGGIIDPALNVKLRLAVEKAKQSNVPKDTIQRAIEKGAGPEKSQLKEIRYEAFGPHGAALLIIATTDNPNRTSSEIRNKIEKYNGKLGSPGSVAYLFKQSGVVHLDKTINKESDIFEFAEKVNAIDIEDENGLVSIYFPFEFLGKAHGFLGGLEGGVPELDYRPLSDVQLLKEQQEKVAELIEVLEDLEDVQDVYTNVSLIDI